MQTAEVLPHYLADWTAALAEVTPGFHILNDMQIVNQTAKNLLADFQAVEPLIAARGVRTVAEMHVPGLHTRRLTDEVTTDPGDAQASFYEHLESRALSGLSVGFGDTSQRFPAPGCYKTGRQLAAPTPNCTFAPTASYVVAASKPTPG